MHKFYDVRCNRFKPHSSNVIYFLLQQLEQEKHRLRCELEVMEEEYEQRITELQSDLSGTLTVFQNETFCTFRIV